MSAATSSLSLQQKVSLSLGGVMVLLILLSIIILDAVVAPAFDNMESEAAQTNHARARHILAAEVDNIVSLAADWAPWDDAYTFARGENASFAQSNLQASVLEDLQLNMVLFYNRTGEMLWGMAMLDHEEVDLHRSGVFGTASATERRLTVHADVDSAYDGIVNTDFGPMLLSSNPITKTSGEGPVAGTVILGRLLNGKILAKMRERTEVDLSMHPFNSLAADHDDEFSLDQMGGDESSAHVMRKDFIDSRSLVRDIHGEPIYVLHVRTARQISALGGKTVRGALLMLAVAMTVVALVIWALLRNIVVKPLEILASHISEIRESGDLKKRLQMYRGDEIGALVHDFDSLTGNLDDARKLLLEQSFKAGKADTAAEVMHNIRNAMTPLINGIDRLGKVFSVTKSLKFAQAMRQLEDETCPPERQKKLLQYIDASFRHVEASHVEGEKELLAVSRQARQVEAIISDQERHAVGGPLIETLELDELLDEAALVIPKRKKPQVAVDMPVALAAFRVQAHRVGLLQVLGNVMLNAYEAIQRSDAEIGRISLSVSREVIGEKKMVRVVVADTGCGFESDKRQKIFQRGYSSKSDKSGKPGGLGLHWCANAMAAMGGRILAESEGAGQGARFYVLLPAHEGA